MLKNARIGIDIGRVIMAPTAHDGRADTSFLHGSDEQAMQTPPADGAMEVIGQLVQATKGNVWLVSKAGPRIAALTTRWLSHVDFFRKTALPEGNVRFCRERADKALHARQLRLTHFIDDRADVLGHLRHVVPNLFLFGHQPERRGASPYRRVLAWSDVRDTLLVQPEGNTMYAGGTCSVSHTPLVLKKK